MNVELVKTFRFEAAHRTVHKGEPCLHGHSYEVDLHVKGVCDERLGWLVDYGEISDQFAEVQAEIDHQLLNEVEGVTDPTLPGLRTWLHARLAKRISHFHDVGVRIVGPCALEPVAFHADDDNVSRLQFVFEAAHALPYLPPEHKCRRMHGHSFQVELASTGGSDTLVELARRLYDGLDHRCLNEIAGLDNPTSEHVARWIAEHDRQAPLTTVTVAETCTSRCVYRAEDQ